MVVYNVIIRETHNSHRRVELPLSATPKEVLDAAFNAPEISCEFAFTNDSGHLINGDLEGDA